VAFFTGRAFNGRAFNGRAGTKADLSMAREIVEVGRTEGADADGHANAENAEGRGVTAGVDADRSANIERERDG
jgi:hypothetical protein